MYKNFLIAFFILFSTFLLLPIIVFSQTRATISGISKVITPKLVEKGIQTMGTPVEKYGLGIYWDAGCTQTIEHIDWETLFPGSKVSRIVFIRQESSVGGTIHMITRNWNPPELANHMTLTWNYSEQILYPQQAIPINLTLSVDYDIRDVTDFRFEVVISDPPVTMTCLTPNTECNGVLPYHSWCDGKIQKRCNSDCEFSQKCEYDCGAEYACDEQHIPASDTIRGCMDYNMVSYYGGTCDLAGQTYFQDKCDDSCIAFDKDNICKSPGSLCWWWRYPVDGCNADSGCNNRVADSTWYDDNLKKICSSNCKYTEHLDTRLGNPIIIPAVPFQNTNFTLYCPTSEECDCVNATAIKGDSSSNCPWIGWDTTSGYKAIFNCSGMVIGNYTAECYSVAGTGSNCIPSQTEGKYRVILCPDFTGEGGIPDGRVNLRDINVLIAHFNAKPYSPKWDPNMDLNNDDVINMKDIQMTILDFNKKCERK